MGRVRVRFPRLPDGERSYCVIERADGVRYRVPEGVAGPEIPHDLVHLVEHEMHEDSDSGARSLPVPCSPA